MNRIGNEGLDYNNSEKIIWDQIIQQSIKTAKNG